MSTRPPDAAWDEAPVAAAFADAFCARAAGEEARSDEHAALVGETVLRGVRAWPELSIDGLELARYVADRLPTSKPIAESLLALRIGDLALAMACGQQAPRALETFELLFGEELLRVFRRVVKTGDRAPDLLQTCRQKLFVTQPPKIADYTGRGDLRHWLRVMAVRLAIDSTRGNARKERPEDRAVFEAVPASQADGELDYFKRHYASQYQAAFEQAAQSLSPDERNLLRQHFAHDLSVDQIGALHGIHRATAARRVGKARDRLIAKTKSLLMEKLAISAGEFDSVMRLIESRIHLSVSRVLGDDVE